MTPNGNLLLNHIEPAAVITITVTDDQGIERIDMLMPKIRQEYFVSLRELIWSPVPRVIQQGTITRLHDHREALSNIERCQRDCLTCPLHLHHTQCHTH